MSGADDRVREARFLAARGRGAEALAEVESVLDDWPQHLPALLLKAALLQQAGAAESSLALYERAVGLAPASAEAWNERARCLHALGRDDEALEAARQARALLSLPANAAHWAAVHLTLLWCLREKRLLREALEAAEEALARTPDAVIAEWASQVEQELAEAERERC
ncbi:MAG TPA: tetratricopeptide repeat protein [Vicinamibacteria bacterium]|nr:tetratricopeptide repeat protein [Vicinamibacteria bacterium]